MQFETYTDALKHFSDLGVDDKEVAVMAKSFFTELAAEEAEKMEKSFFAENSDAATTDASENKSMLKSIGDNLKALTAKMSKSHEAAATDTSEGLDTLSNNGDEVPFDASDMLFSLQKGLEDLTQLVTEKVAYDHTRDEMEAVAFGEIADMRSEMKKSMELLKSAVTIGEGENAATLAKGMEAIMKSVGSGRAVDLNALNINADPTGDGNDAPRIKFNEMQEQLKKGVKAGNITAAEMINTEDKYKNGQFSVVKSMLAKAAGGSSD